MRERTRLAREAAAAKSSTITIDEGPTFVVSPEVIAASEERLRKFESERIERELAERFGKIGNDGFADCGLPSDYVRKGSTYRDGVKTLSTYQAQNETQRRALNAVTMLAQGSKTPPWVYLWSSEMGLGKTHLMASALAYHIREGGWGRYARITTFLDEVRPFENRVAMMKKYVSAPLLVIDDLGSERPTEASIALIAQLIDSRYMTRKPTMVASNFSLRDLATRLVTPNEQDDTGATRIVERIYEMSGGSKKAGNVEMTGKSWRKR